MGPMKGDVHELGDFMRAKAGVLVAKGRPAQRNAPDDPDKPPRRGPRARAPWLSAWALLRATRIGFLERARCSGGSVRRRRGGTPGKLQLLRNGEAGCRRFWLVHAPRPWSAPRLVVSRAAAWVVWRGVVPRWAGRGARDAPAT